MLYSLIWPVVIVGGNSVIAIALRHRKERHSGKTTSDEARHFHTGVLGIGVGACSLGYSSLGYIDGHLIAAPFIDAVGALCLAYGWLEYRRYRASAGEAGGRPKA